MIKDKNNKYENLTKAQQFCLDVEKLALEYNLPFFLVTEGASITRNTNCEAVRMARKKHMDWEKIKGLDSKHNWSLK